MRIQEQFLTALKWSAISRALLQVVSWSVTLVVMASLQPSDYGLMALATIVIAIGSGIADIGLGASIIQRASLSTLDVRRLAGAILSLNFFAGGLIFLASPWIARLFGDSRISEIVQVCSIIFLLNGLSVVGQALAAKRMRFKALALIDLASGIFASLLTLVLVELHAGVWALVAGLMASAACRTVLLLVLGNFVKPAFSTAVLRQHLGFSSAITLSKLNFQLLSQVDLVLAGRLLSIAETGAYSVGVHLARMPVSKIMGTINQIIFSAISAVQLDLVYVKRSTLKALEVGTFVSIPLLWGLAMTAPEVVLIALGEKWAMAGLPLSLVSMAMPLQMMNTLLLTIICGMGFTPLINRHTAVNFFIIPACLFVGVYYGGVNGLAGGWIASATLTLVLTARSALAALGVTVLEAMRVVRGPFLGGTLMCLAVVLVDSLMAQYRVGLRLGAMVSGGFLTYVTVLMVVSPQSIRLAMSVLYKSAKSSEGR